MQQIIRIEDTSFPSGVIQIVQRLPRADEFGAEQYSIVLQFADHFYHQTGLVLLCTWRKTLPSNVKVSLDDSLCKVSVQRLFTNIGFREIIESGVESASTILHATSRIPIQPIVKGVSTEQVIADITQMFDHLGQIKSAEPFHVLLSELCENTLVHSEFETPGYICAHHHEKSFKCEIAIADSGIGIANSYKEGTNEEAKKRIEMGASPIEIALDGLSSSKPIASKGSIKTFYGWGLFIARRLIELNQGRIVVVSGDEAVTIEKFKKDRLVLDHWWNGTFVGLLIDTGNAIPLADVYQEAESMLIPEKNKPQQSISQEKLSHRQLQGEEISIVLASYGKQLLTRDQGITIRADIATQLATGKKIKIILDDIDDVTPSVVDESFGKLAAAIGREKFEHSIVFSGGHAAIHRLLGMVLSGRLRT